MVKGVELRRRWNKIFVLFVNGGWGGARGRLARLEAPTGSPELS